MVSVPNSNVPCSHISVMVRLKLGLRPADGTLLIFQPFRRPSDELCFQRMQLQQALLYEAPAAAVGSRPACIKPFDNLVDGADAFIR